MRPLRRTCTALILCASAVIPAAASAEQVRAASLPIAHYYQCLQSDSVDVGPNFPADAPPPQWALDKMKATMHANGKVCFSINGGTPQQQLVLQSQIVRQQSAEEVVPDTWPNSCTATDYFVSYTVTPNPVASEQVLASVHYSVGATCLHKFYYTAEYDNPSNSNLGWDSVIDCGRTHTTLCTSKQTLNNDALDITQYAYYSTQQTNNVDQTWTASETYCWGGCGPSIPTTSYFTTN